MLDLCFVSPEWVVVGSFNFALGSPRNMSITPDCSKIYVGLQSANVGVIRTANDALSLIAVPSGDSTYATAVLANGMRVYVTDEDDDEVEVIDVATDTVLAGAELPIPAGSTPRGIATAGGARGAAMAPAMSPVLLAILALSFAVLGWVSVGRRQT